MISLKLKELSLKNKNEQAVHINNKFYSYQDLLDVANKTSHLQGKKVIIAYEKSFEYIAIVFSSFINQFTFTPISLKNPIERNNKIIEDVQPDIILSREDLQLPSIQTFTLDSILKEPTFDNRKNNESFLSYIMYTSGSTGEPKGVKVSSLGLDNVISAQVRAFSLNKSKMFFYVNTVFDASISDILCSFYSGSCLYIDDGIRTQFNKFHEYLIEHNISYIDLPPSVLPYMNFSKLPSLKTIIVGGEIPNLKLITENVKYLDIFNVYGPTEASICTSIHKCDQNFNQAYIGNPINGIEYEIFDDELYIAGSGLFIGYTNEKLNDVLFSINNKTYYKTGDIVKKTNDNYLFIGRNDSQIKNKGQLVNLNEIILEVKKIDGVLDAFAYFDKDIYLFVEGKDSDIIKNELKKQLPSYMLPKHIFYHDKFKRNSSNKIDKTSILNQYDFFLANKNKDLAITFEPNMNHQGNYTLLTGSTGSLGIYLLEKLTQNEVVICLVRNKSNESGLDRIKKNALTHNLNIKWDNVIVIEGDCSLHNLGIDLSWNNKISKVIHCAADVNNLKNYDELYSSNVLSVKNVLDFSKNKKLEYISTLSVFVSTDYDSMQRFNEGEIVVKNIRFNNAYAATKWQAEHLVTLAKNKGMDISIYRLGLITESLNNTNSFSRSFLNILIENLQKMNNLPDIKKELYIDISPISMVAEDLFKIMSKKQSKIYNVSYNIKLSYKEIVENMKKERIESSSWFKNNKYSILSHLMSIANNEDNKKKNMNIFETTMCEKFENDNFIDDSERKNINEEMIKNHYLKKWGL